jgi:predicted unusual protein kinase regulating ubiquinone biosynthesis (AarF/ABC1/UbiB family)/nucleotide-binding universal stress UspA family protein
MVERILVATDRSETATRAVEWAAEMAERYSAELLLLQVLAPEHLIGLPASGEVAAAQLAELAMRMGGPRGRARVELDSRPAETIVQVAMEERADIIVVGNVGMRERTEFLLGSVPNRVSHTAPCTVVIVNTSSGEHGPPGADRAQREGERADEGRLLGRAARIAAVLGRYGLGNALAKDRDSEAGDEARAQRFRRALEELGPTFAKLGQILSTRPDLIPPAFERELAKLQDQVTPLSEAEVVAVMERELAVPWEDVFEGIEPQPMAAGTIAQLHRAVQVGGERVVVKVQRPDAEPKILQDLGLLEQFAAKTTGRPAFTEVIDLPAIIEHLSVSLRNELDFGHEATNLERMQAVLAPFDRLDVPAVHTDLSTSRLLVMQEVQGVPVPMAPDGEARRAAGRQLLEAFYEQVLAAGFFHADPHPGNMMWWNDTVYLLDLGMVGEVDPELRRALLLLLLAFWREDTEFLAELMLSLSPEPAGAGFDASAFQAELAELVSRYRHLPLNELRLGPLIQQLTEMSLRHGVRLPAALALIGKAFGQMQLAAAELDPSLDPFSVAGAFYLRQVGSRVRTTANPRRLFYEAQKLGVRAARLLDGLQRLVGAHPATGLQVDLLAREQLTGAITLTGRRIALGLSASTAIVSTAITATSPRSAPWTTPTFGAAAGVLTGTLLADLLIRR